LNITGNATANVNVTVMKEAEVNKTLNLTSKVLKAFKSKDINEEGLGDKPDES
jgi:hypothetical protein